MNFYLSLAAIFLKRFGHNIAFGVHSKVTAAPAIDIISRDCGVDVPVFHLFLRRGAQPQNAQ